MNARMGPQVACMLPRLWRKNSFGSGGESGCCFMEWMLTVTQTLRMQGRHMLSFLRNSLQAVRQKTGGPKLVAAE